MVNENIFFIILIALFISTKDSLACFSTNEYHRMTIRTGSTFYYECQCKEPENAIKSLKWLDIHNQEVLTLGPGTKSIVYTEWSERGLSLQIPYMSKTMSGEYKCITENNGKNYTLTYNIEAYEPPRFIHQEENQYIIQGKDSLIGCEPRSENDVLIRWYKGEEDINEISDGKYEITGKGLVVKNVSNEDAGIYRCSATLLEYGEDIEIKIKVDVVIVPVIHELKVIPEKTVIIGEPLSMECIAEGKPHPNYVWTKISNPKSNNITWKLEANALIIDSVDEDDRGTYTCIASNIGGNVKREVNIEVLVPPSIIEFKNVTASEGSIAQVICKAKGRSRPKITFVFEMDGVDEDPSVILDIRRTNETETIFNLSFQKVNRSHEGFYICNASNEVDFVTESAYLEVLYKPYFNELKEVVWGWHGETVNLSCEHDSNPPSRITWRFLGNEIQTHEQVEKNKLLMAKLNNMKENSFTFTVNKDTLYGVYECIATNDIGEAKKTITLKRGFPPPPVKHVFTIEVTAKSATFSIRGPDEVEGPDISGFTCEYDTAENYNITDIHPNRTWSIDRKPYKLEKLKPNTVYYARFAAKNSVGDGAYSEAIHFKTPEKSVPDTPTWGDILGTASNHVLKWKTPEHNGDPIDFYVLKHCPTLDGEIKHKQCKEDRISPANEVHLTDLMHNTTYYLQLIAHNSQGNSSAAETFIEIPARAIQPTNLLSASAIIGIAVCVVLLCFLVLDLLLFWWRKQGIMASCCYRKNSKRKEETLQTRDTKGLLKESKESTDDTLKPDGHHKQFEYNKTTGTITGKHSAV